VTKFVANHGAHSFLDPYRDGQRVLRHYYFTSEETAWVHRQVKMNNDNHFIRKYFLLEFDIARVDNDPWKYLLHRLRAEQSGKVSEEATLFFNGLKEIAKAGMNVLD
jgi:hypothetical protein